ncbi:MAG: DUF4292 domain-containing protein [Crocinitomicaceae bacterium]|tara:strand:- start:9419 stop:10216 length:798 start_codon:yes stop_codon:yes gene_type:complete
MLNKTKFLFVVLCLFISGCAKQWTDSETKPEKLPKLKQKDFITKLDSISLGSPKFMYTKLKVNYKEGDRKFSFKTTLKNAQDSAVIALVSFARIPVFSALIDTSSLTLVNKKDKCYSKDLLLNFSKKSGVDFRYDNIEEVIYGHAIGFSKNKKYHMLNDPFNYKLSSHRKGQNRRHKDIVYTYNLHKNQKHLESTHIQIPFDSVEIKVNYLEWQTSEGYLLPKKIVLNLQTPKVSANIQMEYTRIDVLTPEPLFLIIPEKYEKCD